MTGYSFEGPEDRSAKTAIAAALARGFVIVEAVIASKEERLALLKIRRDNPPEKIDNSALWAGSSMYYYCISCGHGSDMAPEKWYRNPPRKMCPECQALKDLGWLD